MCPTERGEIYKVSENYSDESKYIQEKIIKCGLFEMRRIEIKNTGRHKSTVLHVILCQCMKRAVAFSKESVRVFGN